MPFRAWARVSMMVSARRTEDTLGVLVGTNLPSEPIINLVCTGAYTPSIYMEEKSSGEWLLIDTSRTGVLTSGQQSAVNYALVSSKEISRPVGVTRHHPQRSTYEAGRSTHTDMALGDLGGRWGSRKGRGTGLPRPHRWHRDGFAGRGGSRCGHQAQRARDRTGTQGHKRFQWKLSLCRAAARCI